MRGCVGVVRAAVRVAHVGSGSGSAGHRMPRKGHSESESDAILAVLRLPRGKVDGVVGWLRCPGDRDGCRGCEVGVLLLSRRN